MTLEELVENARRRLEDLGGDMEGLDWKTDDSSLLWSNDDLVRYANEAENEFCRRRPILDSETASVCELAVTAGTGVYAYSPLIVEIKRAKLDTRPEPLAKVTTNWLDHEYQTWEDWESDPWYLIDDETDGKLRIVAPPTVDDTLRMTVGRRPLQAMTWVNRATDTPEIPEQHHNDLLHWMLHLAYLKDDAETYDPTKSAGFAGLFTNEVGPPISAEDERKKRRRSHLKNRVRTHY